MIHFPLSWSFGMLISDFIIDGLRNKHTKEHLHKKSISHRKQGKVSKVHLEISPHDIYMSIRLIDFESKP